MLSIDQFKAKLVGGGARTNLFNVKLTFPAGVSGNAELASFMIKSAALPATSISPIEVPFRGRILKVAGARTFENWTITVINDNTMDIRNTMEQWANLMAKQSSAMGQQVPNNYMADLYVQQLDKEEKVTKEYKFVSAFPVNVAQIELSSDGENVEEFTVEFAYQYWTSVQGGSTI